MLRTVTRTAALLAAVAGVSPAAVAGASPAAAAEVSPAAAAAATPSKAPRPTKTPAKAPTKTPSKAPVKPKPAPAANANPAARGPVLPLAHAGRWITDAHGRVVILHGTNVVDKAAPFYPSALGFDADDAAFLKSVGLNAVRVGVLWQALEPEPGVFDTQYLGQIKSTVQTLAKQGIVSLLDFHQDMLGQEFQGEGWPSWAIQDGGLANPTFGFPDNYLQNPALQNAENQFWANAPVAAAGNADLQTLYAGAWSQVAGTFKGNRDVLGYELMNEPWAGSSWSSCYSSTGCPAFDQTLSAFYKQVDAAIRAQDPKTLVWYEPEVAFSEADPTTLGPLADAEAGFSFHDYCATPPMMGVSMTCDQSDAKLFRNAVARATSTHDALLNTEFGATPNALYLQDMVTRADRNRVPWLEWAYTGIDDLTTTGIAGSEGIVRNPGKSPIGPDVNINVERGIVEPYPQVIAGTPNSYGYGFKTGVFKLSYTTTLAATPKRRFPAGAVTTVAAPKFIYPHGYKATVHGATIVSKPNATTLELASDRGARTVTLTLTRATRG